MLTMVGKVLLWISGFILSSIVVYQAIESTVAYIEGRHTFLSSSFDDQKNAKFPDLTICLRSPHGNMIPLKAQGIYHINLHAFAFCYSYDRGYWSGHPCWFMKHIWGKISFFWVAFFKVFHEKWKGHTRDKRCRILSGSLLNSMVLFCLFWFSTYTQLTILFEIFRILRISWNLLGGFDAGWIRC